MDNPGPGSYNSTENHDKTQRKRLIGVPKSTLKR